jgi:glyoxylase-like metal-dependent hydrolase (beta-lactamase superfamily II)
VAVDPGGDADIILTAISDVFFGESSRDAKLDAILITHCHADHIAAVAELKRKFPSAVLCVPAAEAHWLSRPALNLSYFLGSPVKAPEAERLVADGDIIAFGGIAFEALLCPGHSPGGACYLAREAGILFAGDVLFAGSIGRGDLPGGDGRLLVESIRRKLFALPPDIRVLPGHGPETTIGEEKGSNPFLAGSDDA